MRKISRNEKALKENNFLASKPTKRNIDRGKKVLVKTAKGRKLSSTNWLRRQLNDPFVKLANQKGFRGRAAFKLIEIDDKYSIFKYGDTVIDLGAAPGSWSQVAVDKINANKKAIHAKIGRVLGIDLKPVSPIIGAEFHVFDFLEVDSYDRITKLLPEFVDVIISLSLIHI